MNITMCVLAAAFVLTTAWAFLAQWPQLYRVPLYWLWVLFWTDVILALLLCLMVCASMYWLCWHMPKKGVRFFGNSGRA